MKRIIVFALSIILAALVLGGCGWNKSISANENNDGRMLLIYNDGFSSICVDTETGIEYYSRANCGTCVMIDSYGNPYIYPGFDAREDRP